MIQAVTSNDTASSATSKALDGIVKNLNELAGKSSSLKALLAPSEQVLHELHHFATAKDPDVESRSVIADGFQEFGIQVADGLRNLYKNSKASFKGLLQRAETITGKLKSLIPTKKEIIQDKASENAIKKLVKYAADNEAQIEAVTNIDTPTISFKSKSAPGRPNLIVDVKEPLKLFKYIELAYKRNKIVGRDPDYKIKGWIQLAYCIQKHSESNGRFVASKKDISEGLSLRPRSLGAEAASWNQAVTRTKQKSSINDYVSLLNDEAIQARDQVLEEHNRTNTNRPINSVKDPNKLMEYLILTKKMQGIKLLVDNQPEAQQSSNFRSLDIVMQWYIQLGSKDPTISLQDYARNEFGIVKGTDLANIKRIKSIWNRGKLTE